MPNKKPARLESELRKQSQKQDYLRICDLYLMGSVGTICFAKKESMVIRFSPRVFAQLI